MIKITIEVDTQEEFDLAYQAVMPAIGEVCDGVGMRTLVGIVKGGKKSWQKQENALMDWLNTRQEWLVVDERPHPLTPSPAERGELEKEKVIVNTLRKLEYEDLKKLKDVLDGKGVPKVPVVEIDVVRFLKEQSAWERQHGWQLLKDNITVEDVSLEMMQDDTTPIVSAEQKKN